MKKLCSVRLRYPETSTIYLCLSYFIPLDSRSTGRIFPSQQDLRYDPGEAPNQKALCHSLTAQHICSMEEPSRDPATGTVDPETLYTKQSCIGGGSFGKVYKG